VLNIDFERNQVEVSTGGGSQRHSLDSPEAFALLSDAWLRAGWGTKHVYTFTWMGRPIIQLPEDMLRAQEAVYQVKPDVLVETGVAHGGSLVFYASLFRAMGRGRVIGVDVEIRPHNRAAIEDHELFDLITLVEGSSVDPAVVAEVSSHIGPGDRVLVMLDSNHTRDHVRAELEAYAPLVTVGSYIVAADGIMERLAGAPRSQPDWSWNNPKAAAAEFVAANPAFVIDPPPFAFNESSLGAERVTYWPGGWIRRVS